MDGHEEKNMAKKLRYALPILAAFLFIAPIEIAQAAPKGGAGDSEITAVVPDYETSYLDIYGSNLSDGIEPFSVVVTLDDIPLSVISATSTWVEVDASLFFADDPTPGDYILVFDSGLQKSRTVEFMLTLGAVGPEGPPGQSSLKNQACSSGQFLSGFDAEGAIICSGVRIPGDSCPSLDYCEPGLFCTDGTCCNSSCEGICQSCTSGDCQPATAGQDPREDCGAVGCSGYFYGWSGDSCYFASDVTALEATCNGEGACKTANELCGNSSMGVVASTCDSTCQEPTAGTCVGMTGPECTNLNLGSTSCGEGRCLTSAPRCLNGAPNACVPNDNAIPEECNGIDDDCDGVTDEDFDLSTDLENCGGCGRGCLGLPNATPACENAYCVNYCDPGWGDCNHDPSDGCEAPDPLNACDDRIFQ